MPEFLWDADNERHVREHDVEPFEAEEALLDPDRLSVDAYKVNDEPRWALLGETEDGRVLFVVFTRRRGAIRVVTARPPGPRERRRYRRKKR